MDKIHVDKIPLPLLFPLNFHCVSGLFYWHHHCDTSPTWLGRKHQTSPFPKTFWVYLCLESCSLSLQWTSPDLHVSLLQFQVCLGDSSVHSLQKPSCPNGTPVTQSQEDSLCNTLVQCSLSAVIMLYKKSYGTWLGYLNHALKWHEQGNISLRNASAEQGGSGSVDTQLFYWAFLTFL